MNEQQSQTTSTATSERPAPRGSESWPDYWKARGMPWRTEQEIDEKRQQHLARQRDVEPDVLRAIYPFADISPKLTRGDIEWLLATHEDGQGPVYWPNGEARDGLDLRGADLRGLDLSGLPMGYTRAGLHDSEPYPLTFDEVTNLNDNEINQFDLGFLSVMSAIDLLQAAGADRKSLWQSLDGMASQLHDALKNEAPQHHRTYLTRYGLPAALAQMVLEADDPESVELAEFPEGLGTLEIPLILIVTAEQRQKAAIHLKGSNLEGVDLRGAILTVVEPEGPAL